MLAVIAALSLLALPAGSAPEQPAKAHAYVGSIRCKTCHMGAAEGQLYESWSKTPHANALKRLPGDKQLSPECIGCHTTGYRKGGFDPKARTAAGQFGGVQCEACHGPGADYMDMKVMSDSTLSAQHGLLNPTEKTCLGCHLPSIPKACWGGAKKPPTFVYADMIKLVDHRKPTK